ncbi:AEC family transporter [Salmonella enterica subsp. enterica serovar Kokomlemle]
MSDLTWKVSGLFIISCLGFIYGVFSKSHTKEISNLLINVISPVVVIISIIQSPGGGYYLYYSLGAFLFCSFLCVLAYFLSALFLSGKERNLFSFTAGTGNTGYFALPIALSLFSEDQISIAIFIIIGVNIYEFSVGYYFMNMGRGDTKSVLHKTLRLPVLYAAILGIALKSMSFDVNNDFLLIINNFKGAYSVLGMLLIGIVLASSPKSAPDIKFMSVSLLWKHCLVPLLSLLFVFIPEEQFKVVFLMALTPLAGNTVVFSSSLDLHPEKAATSVLLSSLISVVLIPVCMRFVS